jgi:hypothetical protein
MLNDQTRKGYSVASEEDSGRTGQYDDCIAKWIWMMSQKVLEI